MLYTFELWHCLSSLFFFFRRRLRVFWDLGVILPIILYLCFILPFRLSFDNEPVFGTKMYWFEFMIDMVRNGVSSF